MNSSEETAAALRASKAINHGQQALTDESRVLLASLLRDEMRTAVREGIADAMTDDNAERFWLKGFEIAQDQAANRVGLLALSGLKKAMGIGLLVLCVWVFLGTPAAKGVLAAFTKGG